MRYERKPVIPQPAIVRVKAGCGHYDTYLLGPGQTLQIGGTFTYCDACNDTATFRPSEARSAVE